MKCLWCAIYLLDVKATGRFSQIFVDFLENANNLMDEFNIAQCTSMQGGL